MEWLAVSLVSVKCNLIEQLCPDKQANNITLMGQMEENEQIVFRDAIEEEHAEITDNENMDDMFDIEIEETLQLASALDLLPDFMSIPIGEYTERENLSNIDNCLQILQNIDKTSTLSLINRQDQMDLVYKMCEMRKIIDRLQTQIIGETVEGYPIMTRDKDEDEEIDIDIDDSLNNKNRQNITIMGECQFTTI